MTKKQITYPFKPKTNKDLIPGQFWGIPLRNGKYACGRVIELPPKGYGPGERVHFLVGLMDWVGDELPTSESIAGHKILDQGVAHLITIWKNGEKILGQRSLEFDNLESFYFVTSWARDVSFKDNNDRLLIKGFTFIRHLNTEEKKKCPLGIEYSLKDIQLNKEILIYGVRGTWGYDVISVLAEDYYKKGLLKK